MTEGFFIFIPEVISRETEVLIMEAEVIICLKQGGKPHLVLWIAFNTIENLKLLLRAEVISYRYLSKTTLEKKLTTYPELYNSSLPSLKEIYYYFQLL